VHFYNKLFRNIARTFSSFPPLSKITRTICDYNMVLVILSKAGSKTISVVDGSFGTAADFVFHSWLSAYDILIIKRFLTAKLLALVNLKRINTFQQCEVFIKIHAATKLLLNNRSIRFLHK